MIKYAQVILIGLLIFLNIAYVRSLAGGKPALLGDVPWAVQIRYKTTSFGNSSSYICGGVLVINPHGSQSVLTTGNCVTKYKPSLTLLDPTRMIIVAGRLRLDRGSWHEQIQQVTGIARHPDWRRENVIRHDIAVLEIAYPFQLNRIVQPLVLPWYTDMRPDPGLYLVISGWGFTDPHIDKYAERLKFSAIEIISHKECDDIYRWIKANGEDVIPTACFCAGKVANPKYQGMCYGDEGGAGVTILNDTFYVAGIFSWTQPKCGNRYQPNVYTSVAHYMRWITVATRA